MSRTSVLLCVVVAAVGCKQPDPAPEKLSDLLRFTWSHYALEEPTNELSLADAALNLQTWFDTEAETLEEFDPEQGFGASLTEDADRLPDDILVGLNPEPELIDGAAAVGVVVAIRTDCTLADVDRLYLTSDQMTLFPDNYISYDRREEVDYACFAAGECEEASWVSEITNELPLSTTAYFELQNRMRHVQAEAPDGTPVQARLSRTWMLQEAELTPSTIGRWFQNYQMEYIIETPETGGTLHIYPQWVHVQLGELNTEANAFLNSYIDGLREYVLQLETHCVED